MLTSKAICRTAKKRISAAKFVRRRAVRRQICHRICEYIAGYESSRAINVAEVLCRKAIWMRTFWRISIINHLPVSFAINREYLSTFVCEIFYECPPGSLAASSPVIRRTVWASNAPCDTRMKGRTTVGGQIRLTDTNFPVSSSEATAKINSLILLFCLQLQNSRTSGYAQESAQQSSPAQMQELRQRFSRKEYAQWAYANAYGRNAVQMWFLW